ncbi:hypothetical protein DMX11_07700 [Pseudomonas sp. LB-090624]|nr:hypothetical protein DMX11_07700 [Pseudomonas sp. LB-090624]
MYFEWPFTLCFDGACPLCAREIRPLFSVLYRLFCRLRPHLAWLPHPDGGHRCSGEESKCHTR